MPSGVNSLQARTSWQRSRHRKRMVGFGIAQTAAVLLMLLPIVWMYIQAFRPNLDIRSGALIPSALSLDNFRFIFGLDVLWSSLRNSTVIALSSSIVVTTVSAIAAYALSRFTFRGRSVASSVLLLSQLVPALVVIVPLILILRSLGLTDSVVGVAIAHLTLGIPIAVLLLRNYLADIPRSLEEAAMVDGTTRLGALFRIVLPLLRPAVAAVLAFSFILSWGEYLIALSITSSEDTKTLPLAMQFLFEQHGVDLGAVMAFGVVISFPVAVLFMFIQRSFVSNLGTGGVKE